MGIDFVNGRGEGEETGYGVVFLFFFFFLNLFNWVNIIIFLMYKKTFFLSRGSHISTNVAATSAFNRPMDVKSNGGIILK